MQDPAKTKTRSRRSIFVNHEFFLYFSACQSRFFQDFVFRVSLEKGTKKEAPKRSMLDVVEGAMLAAGCWQLPQ